MNISDINTDYSPKRKYFVVKLTDGNDRQWWRLAYRWGLWTFYLQRVFESGIGGTFTVPFEFGSFESAKAHLESEQKWIEHERRRKQVRIEVVG
jgi:hypothetical protein